MNKYIQGMEEIKADERLKCEIINNIKFNYDKKKILALRLQKLISIFALTSIFIIIMIFGFPFFHNNRSTTTQSGKQQLFSGFIVMAYGENKVLTEIKPNTKFLLGKYSLTMNNVPGFPMKIVCSDADTIKLTATAGEFLLWTPENPNIQSKGQKFEIKSGDTVYWSPLDNKELSKSVADCSIAIKAYKASKEIGSNLIKINEDDNHVFNGVILK